MITSFDIELTIESDALDAIPVVAQVYLKSVLKLKYSKVDGRSWSEIKWVFPPKLHCVSICFTGSPAMDTGVMWVYNTVSKQYEEYLTQYVPPLTTIKMLNSTSCFDVVLSKLKPYTFLALENLLLSDS